jgi:hypothetical protein
VRDDTMADDKEVIVQLCARDKVSDIYRVGSHRHSGGGVMSTAGMLPYQDVYQGAVSCAGNHDHTIYNAWCGEIRHGVREITVDMGNMSFDIRISTHQE